MILISDYGMANYTCDHHAYIIVEVVIYIVLKSEVDCYLLNRLDRLKTKHKGHL
jgi:hypothetical protein